MGNWRQANSEGQRFPRVATAVPVRISTVDPEIDPNSGQTFFRSAEETTANLSRGGAFVRSWEPLAAGRRVIATIDLSDWDTIQLVGRVAWTRRQLRPESEDETGYGIEFVGGSAGELARLERFLDQSEPADSARATSPTAPTTTQP